MSVKNNHLKFQSLGIEMFAGIGPKTKVKVEYPKEVDITEDLKEVDNENGLVIIFPEGYQYIEIEGNQGVGKTSLIECIKEATGGEAQANTEHITMEEGKMPVTDKKYKDRFWGSDGNLYNLRVTKSTITLERIEVDEHGEPIKNAKGKENASIMKTPKTMLQQIIGPAGISPMALKNMNGAKQVAWIRSLFNLDVEAQKLELEIKDKYEKAYKARTQANNEYNRLENVLSSNDYYIRAEHWQKYFDETKYEDLEKKVSGVIEKKNQYDNAIAGIPTLKTQAVTLKTDIDDLQEQIRQLQLKLDAKTADLKTLSDRIAAGEKWIEENKGVVEDFENLADARKEASEFKAHEQAFKNMQEEKKNMDHQADEKIRLTHLVDEYAQLKKNYIKQFTPEIEHFEVCIKDEGEPREGLFYKGLPLAILAESELWELATQLWKAMGVKIIYVDNVSSLGSGAIAKFNDFLSSGGAYIFGTKMNRNEDALKISFHNKMPE